MSTVFSHQIIPAATLANAGALPSIPSGCSSATIQAQTAGVYVRRDGTSPDNSDSSEEGLILAAGSSMEITSNLQDVRVQCQAVGNGAVLRVMYRYENT